MINTRTHGIIDYVMGIALIVIPFIFDFGSQAPAALWVPVVLGVIVLMSSVITKYELSIAKIIPMPMHIAADVVVGLLLAVSPWLFGFAEQMWVPHVVLGVLEIGVALATQKHSAYDHKNLGAGQAAQR
jgi:hypothetical protein